MSRKYHDLTVLTDVNEFWLQMIEKFFCDQNDTNVRNTHSLRITNSLHSDLFFLKFKSVPLRLFSVNVWE